MIESYLKIVQFLTSFHDHQYTFNSTIKSTIIAIKSVHASTNINYKSNMCWKYLLRVELQLQGETNQSANTNFTSYSLLVLINRVNYYCSMYVVNPTRQLYIFMYPHSNTRMMYECGYNYFLRCSLRGIKLDPKILYHAHHLLNTDVH